jgi:hypothetical protein
MMKAKPMGMLWMMSAGWRDDLLRAASHSLEALPEHHLTHGMNICTLLDDARRGIRGAAGGGLARLAGDSTSLGYVIPAANATTCLA